MEVLASVLLKTLSPQNKEREAAEKALFQVRAPAAVAAARLT